MFNKKFFKERKLFKKNNDILIYNVPISNKYLFSKFDEILNFFNPFLLRPLYDLICIFAKKINFFKKLLVPRFAPNIFKKSGAEDRHDLVMRSQAILQFNQKDQNNGKMLLEKMGIKNNKYVCLFVRDDNYLKKVSR